MLKGLDPLLNADLLYVLAAMGHGDELIIVDANFPDTAHAERLVRLDGNSATDALSVILSVLPLDTFIPAPCATMAPVDGGPEPAVVAQFKRIAAAAEGRTVEFEEVERFAFYERAADSFAIVSTSERRLYGNVIVTKGIIPPD